MTQIYILGSGGLKMDIIPRFLYLSKTIPVSFPRSFFST